MDSDNEKNVDVIKNYNGLKVARNVFFTLTIIGYILFFFLGLILHLIVYLPLNRAYLKHVENPEYVKAKSKYYLANAASVWFWLVYIFPGFIFYLVIVKPFKKHYIRFCPECHEYNDELDWKYNVLHSQEHSQWTGTGSNKTLNQWTRYRVKFTVNCENCDYSHSFHRDIKINYKSSADITEVLEKQLSSGLIGVRTKS